MDIFLQNLKTIFDIVRLVDVNSNTEYTVDAEGTLIEEESKCLEIPGDHSDCLSTSALHAYSTKGRLEKFECIGADIYYVIYTYYEYKDKPYVLELINKVKDSSFEASIDKQMFVAQIKENDQRLYIDALTGAFNRIYFEEQIKKLDSISAIAILDIDNFMAINDTFGHQCGDEVLRVMAKSIMDNIRESDQLIRYGGDEFLIVFSGIPRNIFREKLERIRSIVDNLTFRKYPDTKTTISIGGVMTNLCDEDEIKKLYEKLSQAKSIKNTVVI